MASFQINGVDYISAKMQPQTQLDLLARLGPLFTNYDTLRGALALVVKRIETREAASGDVPPEAIDAKATREAVNDNLLHAISGMAGAFAKMSDDDRAFVISRVMSLCSRRSGQGMAKIWSESANRPMFEDIDLATMLVIVAEVLKAELLPFYNSGVLNMFAALLR